MRRKTHNPPTPINGGWLRVRDEGDKVTMSLKVVDGDAIADQKEVQLVINSFERGCRFLDSVLENRQWDEIPITRCHLVQPASRRLS